MAEKDKRLSGNGHLHQGHRARMRERFLRQGPDAFETHELLEMLLYHSIPRANTNETAHTLIQDRGTLEDVFFSPYTSLLSVENIGPTSAFMLNLVGALIQRTAQEAATPPRTYHDTKDLVSFVYALYLGVTVERVYVLLFDNGMRMRGHFLLAEGTGSGAYFDAAKLVKLANAQGVTNVLLVHNHPTGDSVPSTEDTVATDKLQITLKEVGIHLLDHFVVGKYGVASVYHAQDVFEVSRVLWKEKKQKKNNGRQ